MKAIKRWREIFPIIQSGIEIFPSLSVPYPPTCECRPSGSNNSSEFASLMLCRSQFFAAGLQSAITHYGQGKNGLVVVFTQIPSSRMYSQEKIISLCRTNGLSCAHLLWVLTCTKHAHAGKARWDICVLHCKFCFVAPILQHQPPALPFFPLLPW